MTIGSRGPARSPAGQLLSTRNLAFAALFAAMTGLGAFVSLPVYGAVPFTLQVFFVLLAGVVLGARLAALSMLVYVLLGLVAPVYAGGTSGLGALLGPAGGYIWGFVAGAFVVGYVAERARPHGVVGLAAACVAGLLPIYAIGAVWLSLFLDTASLSVVVWAGVVQFIPMDLAKVVLAALVGRALVAAPLQLPSSTTGPAG